MASVGLAVTTARDRGTALALGRALVLEGLAACATVLPVARSVYRWRGRVEESPESVVLLKTAPRKLAALRRRLRELHTYELLEDITLATSAGSAYARWVAESTQSKARPGGRALPGDREPKKYTRRK